jgi:hypothetical protein
MEDKFKSACEYIYRNTLAEEDFKQIEGIIKGFVELPFLEKEALLEILSYALKQELNYDNLVDEMNYRIREVTGEE